MTTRAETTLLLLALTTVGIAIPLAGCGQSKCEEYEEHFNAKYEECGNPQTPSSGSTGTGGEEDVCEDAEATKAACLDLCLPNANCECIMNPAGQDCIMKQQAWNDCQNTCNNP